MVYRIATNVCLDAIERRRRSWGSAGRAEVQPVPEDLLEEPSRGPSSATTRANRSPSRFLTHSQVLSPRQRGVLILRDVLGWRAAEVADLLGCRAGREQHPASGARRARRFVSACERPGASTGSVAKPARSLRRAWESADVAGLVRLLRRTPWSRCAGAHDLRRKAMGRLSWPVGLRGPAVVSNRGGQWRPGLSSSRSGHRCRNAGAVRDPRARVRCRRGGSRA